MITLFLFVALLIAGIAYLFWFLKASDAVTAARVRSADEELTGSP